MAVSKFGLVVFNSSIATLEKGRHGAPIKTEVKELTVTIYCFFVVVFLIIQNLLILHT